MKTRILVIFNPAADNGRAKRLENTLYGMVKEVSYAVWEKTTAAGEAKEIARLAAEKGNERVIAVGGDGTTHEVVNGLMNIVDLKRPALGIVPIGSGNDFARSLDISKDYAIALATAITSSPHRVDLGLLKTNNTTQEYWVNVVGIGFDAIVDIHTKKIVLLRGFWLYFFATLQTILRNHQPFTVKGRLDGKDWEKELLMLIVSNGKREGGGFQIAPQAKLNDHLLNYVSARNISKLRMLATIPYFMQGTHSKLPYIETGTLKEIALLSNRPMQIHADGEIIAGFDSKVTQLTIKVIPSVLRVIV